eukprot:9684440-Ditylum_brightwellii.AAC.1
MEVVLGFAKDLDIMKGTNKREYSYIKDMFIMDDDEVMGLLYDITSSDEEKKNTLITKLVPMKPKKKLVHALR